MKNLTLLLALSLFAISSSTSAESYLGANIGKSNSAYYKASELSWFTYTNIEQESYDTSAAVFSLYMGYNFKLANTKLAVEAAWVNFGENSLTASGQDFSPGGDGPRNANVKSDIEGLTFSILLKRVITNEYSAFGRIGLNSWNMTHTLNGEVYDSFNTLTGSVSQTSKESGNDIYIGFGLDYKSFTFELNRYTFAENDVDLFTLGVKF